MSDIGNDLIGSAEIGAKGSIKLHLHTIDAALPHGDADITVEKSNPLYDDVVAHLKGKGKIRQVLSWTDPTPERFREEDATNGVATPKDPTPPTPQPAPPETAQFHQDVQDTVNKLPPEVMNLLNQHKVKIAGVRKVTDEAPELAGQHPRGWPKGSTWDDCDGVYDVSRSTVVVAYEHLDDWTGQWHPNYSVKGVLRHETGHAFNYSSGYLSNTVPFVNAYTADQAAMPADAQKRLTYFLQPGFAGRDETSADVFAHLQGGASFPGYDHDIATYFPKVGKVLADTLANLPKPNPAQPGQAPVTQVTSTPQTGQPDKAPSQ